MALGLLVFALMARGLGPEAFGLVASVVSYATILSLVTDFGFASKTLRDVAAAESDGGHVFLSALSVKLYLTALTIILGTAVLLAFPVPADTRASMIMLGAAVL